MNIELFRFLSLTLFPVIIIGVAVIILKARRKKNTTHTFLDTKNKAMITIYTRGFCPYCRAAKEFLQKQGLEYNEISLERWSSQAEDLSEISGMTTVPQIFSGEVSKENLIGGYDDMMAKFEAGEIFQ